MPRKKGTPRKSGAKKGSIPLIYSKNPPPKINRMFVIEGVNSTPDEWMKSGSWVIVESSNVSAIRYDIEKNELYVQYSKKGKTYIYEAVSEQAAKDMYSVNSMGTFSHQRLQGVYNFRHGGGIARIVSIAQIRAVPKEKETKPESPSQPPNQKNG